MKLNKNQVKRFDASLTFLIDYFFNKTIKFDANKSSKTTKITGTQKFSLFKFLTFTFHKAMVTMINA